MTLYCIMYDKGECPGVSCFIRVVYASSFYCNKKQGKKGRRQHYTEIEKEVSEPKSKTIFEFLVLFF